MPSRDAVVARVAARVDALRLPHPARVAIDGRSASGKTRFADRLAEVLSTAGRSVHRASIDDFHRPGHKHWSARGEYTIESYYDDVFDYPRFRAWVCEPLGPDGDRSCRLRYWRAYEDEPADDEVVVVADDAVVVVDGVFLSRPELRDCWDVRVWLLVDVDEMIRRAVERDTAWVGDPEVVRARYETRNVPLHDLHERRTNPVASADVVIDNNDHARPRVVAER